MRVADPADYNNPDAMRDPQSASLKKLIQLAQLPTPHQVACCRAHSIASALFTRSSINCQSQITGKAGDVVICHYQMPHRFVRRFLITPLTLLRHSVAPNISAGQRFRSFSLLLATSQQRTRRHSILCLFSRDALPTTAKVLPTRSARMLLQSSASLLSPTTMTNDNDDDKQTNIWLEFEGLRKALGVALRPQPTLLVAASSAAASASAPSVAVDLPIEYVAAEALLKQGCLSKTCCLFVCCCFS